MRGPLIYRINLFISFVCHSVHRLEQVLTTLTLCLNECTALDLFSESVHSDDEFVTSSFIEEQQEAAQSQVPGQVNLSPLMDP